VISQKLGEKNIIAITFPAHATNLSRTLDLVFFSGLKKLKATTVGEFHHDSVNAQIRKLLQTCEQTTTSFTIRGSFPKAGMDLYGTTQSF
jgi:hypothetical protein